MSQSCFMMILWTIMFSMIISLIFQTNMSMIEMIMKLITVTFCTCLIMTNFSSFSFYSFIVFLMIIGGLIILFMMFLSLISNQHISMNFKKIFKTLLFTFIMLYYSKYLPLLNFFNNFLYINYNWLIFYPTLSFMNLQNTFNMININQIFNYPTSMIFIMLIFYLLLMLIMITKICLKNNKPLRSIKKY